MWNYWWDNWLFKTKTKDKVGVIKVRLYISFSKEHFVKKIPTSCKNLVVLDGTKESGSIGEPLYLDVLAAIKGSKFEKIFVLNGRYGLGSKNTTPEQIAAVFKNTTKKRFTICIEDDVTKLSLKEAAPFNSTPKELIVVNFVDLDLMEQ